MFFITEKCRIHAACGVSQTPIGHTNLKGGIIMLKFQNNDTTIIATFEDFILTTYVIIDELVTVRR